MIDTGLAGKVALVTGAARGQGRSHCVALAREGASVVALDLCGQMESVPYGMGTAEDLAETVELVRAAGVEGIGVAGDVRSLADLENAVVTAVDRFGRLDVVVANAGVAQGLPPVETVAPEQVFADYLAVDLVGVWNTLRAAGPAMVTAGHGGSVIVINSTSGLKGMSRGDPRSDAYTAAKHGAVGLVRAYALELGPHRIRVNGVHPTAVDTPMIDNDAMRAWVDANLPRVAGGFGDAMHVGRISAADVSDAVVWLASDSSRFVTGVALPVDAGFTIA